MRNFLSLFLILCFQLQSQDRIRGIVKDGNGPIFAVNVFIKSNSEVGTVTDFDGLFVLEGLAKADTLVVSYLGYRIKEIPVS